MTTPSGPVSPSGSASSPAPVPADPAPAPTPPEEPRRGFAAKLWYGYARLIVALRWVIVVAWVAGAVAATVLLPPMTTSADDLESLGADDSSFEAEQRS